MYNVYVADVVTFSYGTEPSYKYHTSRENPAFEGFLEFTKSGSLSGVGCPVAFLWGADLKFQFDQEKIGRSFGRFFGDKNIITESGL